MRLLLNLHWPQFSETGASEFGMLKARFHKKGLTFWDRYHFEVFTTLVMCTVHGGKDLSSTLTCNIFPFLGLRTPPLILVCCYGVCFDLSCILGKGALHFSHLHHGNRLCSNKVRKTVKIAIVLKEKKLSRVICDFYIWCSSSCSAEDSSIRRARFLGSLVFIFFSIFVQQHLQIFHLASFTICH